METSKTAIQERQTESNVMDKDKTRSEIQILGVK
jgi:hypothetical protein